MESKRLITGLKISGYRQTIVFFIHLDHININLFRKSNNLKKMLTQHFMIMMYLSHILYYIPDVCNKLTTKYFLF